MSTVLYLYALYKAESVSIYIYLVNIECIHDKHQWFGMSQQKKYYSSCKKYYSSCFFLINEYFLQFGFGCTSPSNVTIVYVTGYERKMNVSPRFLV